MCSISVGDEQNIVHKDDTKFHLCFKFNNRRNSVHQVTAHCDVDRHVADTCQVNHINMFYIYTLWNKLS